MDEDFLATRLTQLRIQKGVSAREMSLSLGQAPNYINTIENRKSLPSMQAFFFICEYLNITPQEFFDRATHVQRRSVRLSQRHSSSIRRAVRWCWS